MARRRVQGDGVELSVLDEGEGRPVLMLHGFPDSAELWRHQIPALTGAGMRVIAPDLRGFGESDQPEAVADYRIGRSRADMVAVLDALELERVSVVAHDWGATVGWVLAALEPDRVERFAVMSVGHPNAQRERTMESREKAWYTLLFQFEGVSEELLAREDWALLREWMREEGDVERAVESLARPGALTAALNWYRASSHPGNELKQRDPFPSVHAPVLGMWSTGDAYLTEDHMTGSAEWVEGEWRYERIEGASHWMQLDQPERVNELLLDFLG